MTQQNSGGGKSVLVALLSGLAVAVILIVLGIGLLIGLIVGIVAMAGMMVLGRGKQAHAASSVATPAARVSSVPAPDPLPADASSEPAPPPEPVAKPAPPPEADSAPAAAHVKSSQLDGELDLASRKGTWRFEASVPASDPATAKAQTPDVPASAQDAVAPASALGQNGDTAPVGAIIGSSQLAGEAELAARKGAWTYTG